MGLFEVWKGLESFLGIRARAGRFLDFLGFLVEEVLKEEFVLEGVGRVGSLRRDERFTESRLPFW